MDNWQEIYGPNGQAVEALVERARQLTDAEAQALDAARHAARGAARDAAVDAARGAARSAARSAAWNAARSAAWNAVRSAARGAAGDAATDAALALVVHDLITEDQVMALAGPWVEVMGDPRTFAERENRGKWQTKDSGIRKEYPTGMKRDSQIGKPRYDLIDLDFLTRWAELMERGAVKYGEDNWRLAGTQEELRRFRGSAFRHLIQWLQDDQEEDHAAAVAFNLAAAEYTRGKL